MYSTNNHGLMKKGGIFGAHFYKLGWIPKSQSIQVQSPKSNKFFLFKCEFNVGSQGEALGDK
jgi:hypothetical protein